MKRTSWLIVAALALAGAGFGVGRWSSSWNSDERGKEMAELAHYYNDEAARKKRLSDFRGAMDGAVTEGHEMSKILDESLKKINPSPSSEPRPPQTQSGEVPSDQ